MTGFLLKRLKFLQLNNTHIITGKAGYSWLFLFNPLTL
jgi:hypothetical protein